LEEEKYDRTLREKVKDPEFQWVDYDDPKNWGLTSSSDKPVNWHHYEVM